ncbi:MAG: succinyl-diaminopimelate desuccinylase [Hyphomicrobium sp.]
MSSRVSLPLDPLQLSQALIRCASVTPADAGALGVVQDALTTVGFTCARLPFSEPGTADVDNLYARIGSAAPNFCFAGHTDVVPVGDAAAWTTDPFGGEVLGERLYGRGAADMKTAIACFIVAAGGFALRHGADFGGSISLLITGDEEGPAINGTRKVLSWLKDRGERLDGCLVGEPTNPAKLGEMIKIGRRGSLNATLTVHGVQGHAAYPHLADNPIPRLLQILGVLSEARLDGGIGYFGPSHLAITSIDVGNNAANVIPARARATFNIRFNDRHSCASLRAWIDHCCAGVGGRYTLDIECSGEAFVTPPGTFSGVIADAVTAVTGRTPALSTAGGTSDARFIKDVCPVAEFGMVGETAHKIDENVLVADLARLTAVYDAVLETYFRAGR